MGIHRSFTEKEFDSLTECIDYIRTHFKQETISIQAKDIITKEVFTKEVPRYFYRGESKDYPSTYSSFQRVKQIFPQRVVDDIEKVVAEVDIQLRSWLKLDPMLSAGFLQHYGLPTELIDISPSLETAIFFSSYTDSNTTTEEGLFCVFDNSVLKDKSCVIDLSEHHLALRPRLQNAYTFFHKSYLNIKSKDCISDLSLHWFYFKSSKAEKEKYFDPLKYLPNNLDDVTAGYVYMCISDIEFKISDFAANYLVNICQVPAVPIVIDIKTGKAMTFNQARIKYDETVARYNLYRILSNQFQDTKDNHLWLDPFG